MNKQIRKHVNKLWPKNRRRPREPLFSEGLSPRGVSEESSRAGSKRSAVRIVSDGEMVADLSSAFPTVF